MIPPELSFAFRKVGLGFKRILSLLDINKLFYSPEAFICVSEGGLFLPRWGIIAGIFEAVGFSRGLVQMQGKWVVCPWFLFGGEGSEKAFRMASTHWAMHARRHANMHAHARAHIRTCMHTSNTVPQIQLLWHVQGLYRGRRGYTIQNHLYAWRTGGA